MTLVLASEGLRRLINDLIVASPFDQRVTVLGIIGEDGRTKPEYEVRISRRQYKRLRSALNEYNFRRRYE